MTIFQHTNGERYTAELTTNRWNCGTVGEIICYPLDDQSLPKVRYTKHEHSKFREEMKPIETR